MKLIYIRSTMEPKNHSTLRSLLKHEQGEKVAPYIFKPRNTQSIKKYLDQEKITYEIYQEERQEKALERTFEESFQETKKKKKNRGIENYWLSINFGIYIEIAICTFDIYMY